MNIDIEKSFTVVDNFLPQKFYDEFRYTIMDDKNFNWYFVETTAYAKHISRIDEIKDHYDSTFAHMMINEGQEVSYTSKLAYHTFLILASQFDIEYDHIERARLGMIMPTKEKVVHDPHVDFGFKHYTALLYFTDEDEGETIFYDKVWDPDMRGHHDIFMEENRADFKPVETILPKQNRLVLFDGLLYHSSTTPRTKRRLAMNLNFTVKENI